MTHGPIHLDRHAFLAHSVAVSGHQLPVEGNPRPCLVLRFAGADGQPLTVVLIASTDDLDQLDQSIGAAITDAGDGTRFAEAVLTASNAMATKAQS